MISPFSRKLHFQKKLKMLFVYEYKYYCGARNHIMAGLCVMCWSYYNDFTLFECVCGTTYCSKECMLSDVNHKEICDDDFHTRIKKMMLLIETSFLIPPKSLSDPILRAYSRCGARKYFFTNICMFPGIVSGCLTCGKESSTSLVYWQKNVYSDSQYHLVNGDSCVECNDKQVYICGNSYLPSNICCDIVRSLLQKAWYLCNMETPEVFPHELINVILELLCSLDTNVIRLRKNGIKNHKCHRYFTIMCNKVKT